MPSSSSDLADRLIGWVTAVGLTLAVITTAYGYGWIQGVENGKLDITVRLAPGTVCRVDPDGTRLCRAPFVGQPLSREEAARFRVYRRRAV